MKHIEEQIYDIRSSVFKEKYQDAIEATIRLLGQLMENAALDQMRIKDIANMLMQSIQNKDYLLLADIVYFEIPPLWNGSTDDIDVFLSQERK